MNGLVFSDRDVVGEIKSKKREKLEPYLKKLEDKLACMDPADLSAHLNGVTPKLQRTLMDRLTHAQVLGI